MPLTTKIIHITYLTTKYPLKPDYRYIVVEMTRFVTLTPLISQTNACATICINTCIAFGRDIF